MGLGGGRSWFKQWLPDSTLPNSLVSVHSIKSSIVMSRSVFPHLSAFLTAAFSLSAILYKCNLTFISKLNHQIICVSVTHLYLVTHPFAMCILSFAISFILCCQHLLGNPVSQLITVLVHQQMLLYNYDNSILLSDCSAH